MKSNGTIKKRFKKNKKNKKIIFKTSNLVGKNRKYSKGFGQVRRKGKNGYFVINKKNTLLKTIYINKLN